MPPATAVSPSSVDTAVAPLPVDRLERVDGWGMAVSAPGYVYRPSTIDGVRDVLELAQRRGLPVTQRGSGRSYGDAALCPEALILELNRMRRILAWDPESGVLDAEAGVSIAEIWRYALGDGWWPAVVPGTMHPTLGGCLAMNVHGKNCWRRGTVGDHCLELDLLLPTGEIRTLSRQRDAELFHGVIGSFGQLGVITRARWQLKKVSSGLLEVRAVPARDLGEMLRIADDAKETSEYVVGWLDAFAGGKRLGRGQLHLARHLEEGEDPAPTQTLKLEAQDLPDTFFGVIPRSVMWRLMKPWNHRPGMRLVNSVKFHLSNTLGKDAVYPQSLAAFSFLLDYVPGWKKTYLPGGLIQHQSFVPAPAAEGVFRRQLELCRQRGMPSFLAVLKRHRPDPFLLSHAVDGFSLALDFPVTGGNRRQLWRLVRDLAEPVIEAGGRFYPAKDAALPPELFRAGFTDGQLERFAELKDRCDPDRVLTSALAERLLG
ncbi:MAG: FAD-binding oxidoreductase [Acidobacteria bacterium]|nr:FAD-binding oxidoreductase [Acidobacteriota bacterium]